MSSPFRALVALGLLACAPAARAEVFINELHYDDSTASGDVGERVELVATAGEDLSTYRVVLYNGTGSPTAAAPYDDRRAPAGGTVNCGGNVRIAVVAYPSNGIQNGAADGLALVNGAGQVVQFLSYEGAIRGGSGVASGRQSQTLPVEEGNATAPGTSLQLAGTGTASGDFAWQASRAHSFGACNAGQSFVAPPTGYYARVNTSSASQLRCSLHATIRGHTAFPYTSSTGTDVWDVLEVADGDPARSGRILDVYRNRSFAAPAERDGTGTGLTYNREHTWPNSLGFPSTTGDKGMPYAPYTDAHMLYLADKAYNADRGNKPYANCPASAGCGERPTEVNNGTGGGGGGGVYPGNSNWVMGPDGNTGSFEVFRARKGDVARAILYMAIRYEGGVDAATGQSEPDLELTDDRTRIVKTSASPAYMGLLSTLLAWHQADPPTAQERLRNDAVAQFQGNRNPFIDHPEWATTALFTSAKPATCQLR